MAWPSLDRPRTSGRPTSAAATLWGDGFARYSLPDLWAVRDWSTCSPDEYILLFPRLVRRAAGFPAVLRAHLEGCVAARARRLAEIENRDAAIPLGSHLPTAPADAAGLREWFADDTVATRLRHRMGLPRVAPARVAAERALLVFLDRLLSDIQAGVRPAWDETSEVLLAFGAGIHPAYLWPQATVSEARGVTAGWLGHLDRGRTAFMPAIVADHVLDALGGASSDRALMALAGNARNLESLREAARQRCAGQDSPVRLMPGAVPPADLVPARARPGLARADA